MPSTRYYQHQVVSHEGFAGVVEASMMRVAYEVLIEPPATPHHEQRASVARSVFQGMPVDLARFTRLFAWRAVFDPTIQGQVFNASTQAITPEAIDDAAIDDVIRQFWGAAALVPEETGG